MADPTDHPVGGRANRGGARRVPDAEAHGHRERRMPLDPLDGLGDQIRVRHGRTGDAGDRHIIYKARGVRENGREASVVRSRRGEPDERKARAQRRQAEFVILLRRQVHDNQTVDPGGLGVAKERLDPVGIDRIEIAHQDNGRLCVAFAEFRDHFERSAQSLPALQRPQTGGLNRRAVGHRVGERHAELDHIRPGRREGLEDGEARLAIRVPGHDVGDEAGPALRRQAGGTGVRCGRSFAVR